MEHKLIGSFFKDITHSLIMGGQLEFKKLLDYVSDLEDPLEKKHIKDIKLLLELADSKIVFGDQIEPLVKVCQLETLYLHKSNLINKNGQSLNIDEYKTNMGIEYDLKIKLLKSDFITEYGGVIGVKWY